MSRSVIPPPDPRHSASQALAWLDALGPAIRACRLGTRSMGAEILTQGLRRHGIEATTVSRAISSHAGGALAMKTFGRSDGFIHLPCVQGQLFSFDGIEGPGAWAIALSNRHAKYVDQANKQHSGKSDSTMRHHTRYIAPGEDVYSANPLQLARNIDASGNYQLTPRDSIVLSQLINHLERIDLSPAPIPLSDERLVMRSPLSNNKQPDTTELEKDLMRSWSSFSSPTSQLPGQVALQLSTSVMECFREAGVSARLLHRSFSYRGHMEVFDIQRIALEFQLPGNEPSLVCLSAPGGWEGLLDVEKAALQVCQFDYLYAGEVSEIDDLDHSPLAPSIHATIKGLFSSYLMANLVNQVSENSPPPGLRF